MIVLEKRLLRVVGHRVDHRPDDKIDFAFFQPLLDVFIQPNHFERQARSLPRDFLKSL